MRRLYGPHDIWQRWVIISATLLTAIIGVVFLCMTWFTCAVGSSSEASCPPHNAYTGVSIAFSMVDAIVDVLFAVMSVLLVRSTSIGGAAAVSTAALLVVGTVGSVASILRTAVILGWHGSDQNVTNLINGRWSQLEIALTITAGSLATLRPLLKKMQGMSNNDSAGYASNQAGVTAQTKSKVKTAISRHSRTANDEVPLFELGPGEINKMTTVQVVHLDAENQ